MSHEGSLFRYYAELHAWRAACSDAMVWMGPARRADLAEWVDEGNEFYEWPGWIDLVGKPPARGRVDR